MKGWNQFQLQCLPAIRDLNQHPDLPACDLRYICVHLLYDLNVKNVTRGRQIVDEQAMYSLNHKGK